jgi:hypothetical protein
VATSSDERGLGRRAHNRGDRGRGGLFALYRWLNQREQEQQRERQRLNAIYVMSTLFAA